MLGLQRQLSLSQERGSGISSRSPRPASYISLLYALLLLCSLALPALSASAQTVRRWREPEMYDRGDQPSVAMLSTGLVVEVHRDPYFIGKADIWYHIGKVTGGTIQWGKSHKVPVKAPSTAWPQVAVTPKGQVILTYSDSAFSLYSRLYYFTGRLNPDGDTSQTIDWVRTDILYDKGFHNSLALAPGFTNGLFAEVHEADGTGNGLYYRVGDLTDGLYLHWLTGDNGVKYDTGINPGIAISNNNQVVQVHQVPNREYLHYRRGTISAIAPNLSFQDSRRYNDDGIMPAIAFIGPRQVVELDTGNDVLRFSVGTLAQRTIGLIDWEDPTVISVNENRFHSPSVTSNGKVVVSVFQKMNFDDLYFSVANVE